MRLRWVQGWMLCTALSATQAAPGPDAPAVAASSAPANTVALNLAGVRIPASSQVAGITLPLHGAGIRHRFFIKVYTAALYLPGKADSLESVIGTPGPKRLQITMLRDIDSNELGRLFTQGMERNTAREDMARSINGTLRMGELFARRKKLVAGDSFSVDWLPGQGAQVMINGHAELEPVREPEFFQGLLGIWLGKAPADDELKLALLGKADKRRPAEP